MSVSNKSHRSKSSGSHSGSSGSFSKILSLSKSIEKGTFGVLYAMIKNNTFPKVLTIISIVIEFLQLCSFGFKKSFPWGGTLGAGLKKVVSPVNHPANVFAYNGYTYLFWAVTGLMVLAILNILYVAYNFYSNKIANIWLLRTLRWFVSFSVAVLYIPILSLLLIALHCEKDDGVTVVARFNEQIECYGKNNLSKWIVSILMILFFTFISFSSQATYYEYDSSCKDRYSKPHSRFDITILLVKTIFAFFFELLSDQPWVLSILFFLGMIWLCFGSIMFMPFNYQRLNQVKTGFYFVALWVSFCTLLTMIIDNIDSPATAYLAILGLPFTFAGGYLSNKYFYRWLNKKMSKFNIATLRTESMNDLEAQTVKDGATPGKVTFSHQTRSLGSQRQIKFSFFEKKFSCAFFVEIMCRKLLKSQEQQDIDRVNLIYQCALQYYPKSHLLWMSYCNFLFTVRKDRQIGYAALEKLRRISPPFDVRFYIYQRDKEREQIMDSDLRGPDHQGKIQDFVSYMEFKKLYNGAKRYHLKCLTYIQRFWKLLLHETIDLHRLSDLSGRIATTENKANEHYERLLALNPNSVRVLRDFSQFLEDVVKDKDSALRLQKKAEHIEDLMSKSLSHEHIKYVEVQSIDNIDGTPDGGADGGISMEKLDKLDKIERGSHHSKSKDSVSESSQSSKGRQKRYAEFQQSNSITKLSWFMILTVFLSMIFCIAILVSLRTLSVNHENSYQGILTLGDSAIESIQVARDLNSLHHYKDDGDVENYNTLAYIVKLRIMAITNMHHAMYYGEGNPYSYVNLNHWLLKQQDGEKVYSIIEEVYTYAQFNKTNPVKSSLLLDIYNKPVVPIEIYIAPDTASINVSNLFATQQYNAWKAVNIYLDCASIIANYPIDYPIEYEDSPDYRFVINNQENIATAFNNLQLAYSGVLGKQTNTIINIIFYIWLGVFVLLFILAVFLFRPVVSKISREKIKTLILFSMAPRDVVIKMASKKIKMVSLDSSSDRDFAFDTDDEESKNEEEEVDDEIESKPTLPNSDSESTPIPPINNNNNNSIIQNSIKSSTGMFGQSGDTLLIINDGQTKKRNSSIHSDIKKHLIASQNVSRPSLSYEDEEEKEVDAPGGRSLNSSSQKKETKYAWDGKNKRNLNKKSLRSTLRTMHLSYSFALFLLFGFITMGLFVALTQTYRDLGSGMDIALSSQRAVNTRLANFYVSTIALREQDILLGDEDPRESIVSSVTSMQDVHQSLPFIPEVRSLMDGTMGCWLIDQSCDFTNLTFARDLEQGLDWVLDQFTKRTLNLAKTQGQVNETDPDYIWISAVGEDYIYDGLDRATYIYFKHWTAIQENATVIITSILSVVIVLIVLVYLFIYRPFINRLRIQHIHTLALLRLAPDDIRNMEVSDKIVDED
ncbi:HAT repeat-containing protein [Tieghemostelium lacteum]|uniref:HAT repeat-containing protein n=1 Tax=Tieghemostelium lacteum TaxID=361077 RepID=A0A151Z8K0_TIELA|nr:HAT repeat-containing protein [Tieghemostelium lacteum]|eukprot:KYQ90258.1 HAT repeat-containing protein [Tieghemostelium lacteum]